MRSNTSSTDPWLALRQRMVEEQIRLRGVTDPRVLGAMAGIPRERFVPVAEQNSAYDDRALPIDLGQTISQPFIVAYMTELLSVAPENKVLEVGTGSGYQTAVLATLARTVHTIERIDALRRTAERTVAALRLTNVSFHAGDGSLGLPAHAPFDRIIVTAAAPRIPTPLIEQLADRGHLVIPVGGESEQTVIRIIRDGSRIIETPMLACRFVKLIGKEGWDVDRIGN